MATNTDKLLRNEMGEHSYSVIKPMSWGYCTVGSAAAARDAAKFVLITVMEHYSEEAGVMWKDFKDFATGLTGRVRKQPRRWRRATAPRDLSGVEPGKQGRTRPARFNNGRGKDWTIAIMSCVEPCRRWCMRGNKASKKLELSIEWGKCIHLVYWIMKSWIFASSLQKCFRFWFKCV